MRTSVLPRACALCFLIGVTAVSGLSAPPVKPPLIKIHAGRLRTGLIAEDRKQIRARIRYWARIMAEAEDTEALLRARKGLLSDYRKYTSGIYRRGFASAANALVTPVLTRLQAAGTLHRAKEVNFAIALSEMAQLPIQPTLDALVAHRNPGVRYWAWRGYAAIRKDVLIKGETSAEAMLASLAKAAKTEPSPLVITPVFDVLHLPQAPPAGVEKDSYAKVRRRGLTILLTGLMPRCAGVANGQAADLRPCDKALPALKTYSDAFPDEQGLRDTILQHVVNIGFAAAVAYSKAESTDTNAREYEALMIHAEQTIHLLTDARDRFFRRPLLKGEHPLTGKKIASDEKPGIIEWSAHKWVERLKERGIVTPVFKKPQATTQRAATRPAGKPAGP